MILFSFLRFEQDVGKGQSLVDNENLLAIVPFEESENSVRGGKSWWRGRLGKDVGQREVQDK